MAPELAGDDIHLTLDPREFRLGIGHHLVCTYRRVELQSQFLGEFPFAQTPIRMCSRQKILFEELLIILQTNHYRLGGSFQRRKLWRFARKFEKLLFIERNRPAILSN